MEPDWEGWARGRKVANLVKELKKQGKTADEMRHDRGGSQGTDQGRRVQQAERQVLALVLEVMSKATVAA